MNTGGKLYIDTSRSTNNNNLYHKRAKKLVKKTTFLSFAHVIETLNKIQTVHQV